MLFTKKYHLYLKDALLGCVVATLLVMLLAWLFLSWRSGLLGIALAFAGAFSGCFLLANIGVHSIFVAIGEPISLACGAMAASLEDVVRRR